MNDICAIIGLALIGFLLTDPSLVEPQYASPSSVDYCHLFGSGTDVSLSCQLGGDFNSAKGLDIGFPPRTMVDVNGDGRADFCRYVGDPQHPEFSCVLATESGFSAIQYTDPLDFRSYREMLGPAL